MGKIEVILPLHHVVGIFIAERKAEPERGSVRGNHIDAGNLGLLAAIEREVRQNEISAGWSNNRAVALIEPFRLNACRPRRGLAALEAEIEHLDRVCLIAGCGIGLLVHLVAGGGAAEMSKAGPGHQAMSATGMIDWAQNLAACEKLLIVTYTRRAELMRHVFERGSRRECLCG